MRVYFTPVLTRTVEALPPRVQNITKLLSKFIEGHSWEEVIKHSKFQAAPTNEKDLFTLRFDELRYFVSLNRDAEGEFAIMVGLDQKALGSISFKLSDPNLPYDFVHARSHIIRDIQAFAQEPVAGLRLGKFAAQAVPGVSQNEHDGETVETGSVTITYNFRRDSDGKDLPEIKCIIDHGSDWSPTIDVRYEKKRLLLAVYPAWDWAKLINSFRQEMVIFHRKLASGQIS